MPPNPKKTKCTATSASGRPCKAWAVRDTSPPLCAAHSGRCAASRAQRGTIGAGAPLGNQNRADHGFYGRILENGELADLVRFCDDLSLDDEIGLVRMTLRRVMTRFRLNNLDPDYLANEDVMKMASLVMTAEPAPSRVCSAISAHFPARRPTTWISWWSGSGRFQWSHLDRWFGDSGGARVNH